METCFGPNINSSEDSDPVKGFIARVPNPVPGYLPSCKVQLQPWSNTTKPND